MIIEKTLRFWVASAFATIVLLGCQTTTTNLVYPATYLLKDNSTAKELLYWHFADPRVDVWDRFNASYEASHLGAIPNATNKGENGASASQTAVGSGSNEPPPAYVDLLAEPTIAPRFTWMSEDHSILIDRKTLPRLKGILESLELEISILDDNIRNLLRTDRSASFVASKPIFHDGRVTGIAAVSMTPSIPAMIITLTQCAHDYNSVVAAIRNGGYFYLGIEYLPIPDFSGL